MVYANNRFCVRSFSLLQQYLDNHYPPDKLIDFANRHEFAFPRVTYLTPILNALLGFTDGSLTGIATYAWNNQTTRFQAAGSLAQITEFRMLLQSFLYPTEWVCLVYNP